MVLGIFQRWFVRTGLTLLLCGGVADSAWGQFPGGDRGSRGDRGGPPGGDRGGPGGVRGGPGGPGGERGRGGFSMNPDDRFNEYSGGRDSFNVNQLSPEQRSRFDRSANFMGIQPGPDGTVTRDMYRRGAEQMTQRFSQMRGGGGPPGSGGPPGGFGGPPGAMPMGGPPGGFGGPTGGPPGGFGGPPGAPPAAAEMTDESAYSWMRRYDTDGDRRISREEASKSDRIRDNFDQYDANRDGYIDVGEYKLMFAGMMQSRGGDRDRDRGGDPRQGGGPPPQGGGDYNRERNDPRQEEVEQRPVVYRYGKLPKDLPSWFTSLDEDKDGQVGMHEWRADGRTMSEFMDMDLNGDGLITAEEYFRYKQLKEQAVALEARMNGETPPSAFGSRDAGSTRGGSSNGSRSYGSSGPSRGRDPRDANSSRDNRPQDQPGERRPGRNPFGGR